MSCLERDSRLRGNDKDVDPRESSCHPRESGDPRPCRHPHSQPQTFKWLRLVVSFSVLLLFVKLFCLEIYSIPNTSMQPLLKKNQIFLVNKVSRFFHRMPQKNDVVLIQFPNQKAKDVKSIVGLPGDEIRFQQGHVWINGQRDDKICFSSKQLGRTFFEDRRFQVPNGKYFVLGDDCDVSLDSRDFGYVPAENILGYFLWSL